MQNKLKNITIVAIEITSILIQEAIKTITTNSYNKIVSYIEKLNNKKNFDKLLIKNILNFFNKEISNIEESTII